MKSCFLKFGRSVTTTVQSPVTTSRFFSTHFPQAIGTVASFSSYPTSCSSFAPPNHLAQNYIRNELSFGQPTHGTHPEFFSNHLHIIPGITKEEIKDRRTQLCSMAARYAERTSDELLSQLIIVPASSKKYMTENIPYPFRQDSNFFYFTGSYDPESLLVMTVTKDGDQIHTLFLNDPDSVSDLWDGRKTSLKAATEHLGLDQAFYVSNLGSFIRDFALSTERKFLVWCEERDPVDRIQTHLSTEIRPVQSPKKLQHSLRVIKSPGEVELMRTSARIASEAFQSTINFCSQHCSQHSHPPSEHQIWAKIDYECRLRGADRLAYPPVVASGARANIIHYVHNNNLCAIDDMVLVDAGCEFFGYCSDITRTFPVTGKFTNDHQRSLYEMVLEIQKKLIGQVTPGITLDQLFRYMGPLMLQGLQELGIITSSIDLGDDSTDSALLFCPHHVSHYLGMDVHDTSSMERMRVLQPGMIITVEPGVYIQTSSQAQNDRLTKVGREFCGIGIRIEDDVLVTPGGCDVLTSPCPKSVEEIEYWADVKTIS